jgi:hypothetical protein
VGNGGISASLPIECGWWGRFVGYGKNSKILKKLEKGGLKMGRMRWRSLRIDWQQLSPINKRFLISFSDIWVFLSA